MEIATTTATSSLTIKSPPRLKIVSSESSVMTPTPTPKLKILPPKIESDVTTKKVTSKTRRGTNKIRRGRKLENIKDEGDKIHGKDKINYSYIDKDEYYNPKKEFTLGCIDCEFLWVTSVSIFITREKGCPWCRNKSVDLKNLYLFVIQEISDRIHNNKYEYFNIGNDEDKKYKKSENILVKCKANINHKIYEENLGRQLSDSKHKQTKAKGCPECNDEMPEEEKIVWKNNYDAVCRKSAQIFGEGTYSYYLTKPEDLKNVESQLNIICNKLKEDDEKCGNVFTTQVRSHFYNGIICQECSEYKSFSYTKELFIEKALLKYPNGEFLYHRIKDEDIVNSRSKPEIECGKCGYIINNTTIISFLKKHRKCEICNNREPWTMERLKRECEEKEKEGLYSYENLDFSKNYKRRDQIPISCLYCKNEGKDDYVFNQTIEDHFISNHGCHTCGGNKPWKYRLEKECIEKQKEGKYDYSLIDYTQIKNNKTLLPIICLKCKEDGYEKYIFNQSIEVHITMNCGCPRCGKSMQWDYDMFTENKNRLPDVYTSNYIYDRIVPEEFTNARSIISVGCKTCHRYFERSATSHITMMRGCRYCSKSEGSRMVYTFLEKNNIKFIDEYPIPGIKGVNYRYDYRIEYNSSIIILEYDGEHHQFKNNKFHKVEGKFEAARERDIYKQKKALEIGYKIVRLDHTIPLKDIEKYIIEGLNCKEQIYYSNKELYDWLNV